MPPIPATTEVDQPAQDPRSPRPSFLLEIAAISLAAILLEIAYTRVFSFKVYYYFTYVILGVALLGLGSGGVLVAISQRLRASDPARLIPALCLAAGASVGLGYAVIAPLALNVSQITVLPVELLKLVGAMALLGLPFLCTGIAVSTMLGARPAEVSRLYGADLLGAGLGCTACIPLLQVLTPPGTILLSAALFAVSGLRLAVGRPALVLACVGVGVVSLAGALLHDRLPDPTTDVAKQLEEYRDGGLILHSAWDPVFRVDVSKHPLRPDLYVLHHDGLPGSGIHRFRGDPAKHLGFLRDPRVLPFAALGKGARVLIVGAAGGHEILASLFFEAREITALELNPVTVDLLTGRYADFAGRLHEDPRVTLINAEARSYLKGHGGRYDLIWFVAPDSYAAMNASTSAAFVLSESYLYTVEMLREALAHLAPGGVVCAQFGERDYESRPKRTLRYLSTARAAFREQDLGPLSDHALVATAAGLPPFAEATVLLRNQPFEPQQIEHFAQWAGNLDGGRVRHLAAPTTGGSGTIAPTSDGDAVARLLAAPDASLDAFYAALPFNGRPVVDDSPFFWHFVRFRDAARAPFEMGGAENDWEEAIGEQLMLVLLATISVFAAVLLLLPFVAIRDVWRQVPYKAAAGVYFAALGLGFMFIEVCLIQMFTLFLGYPTYSLSVTLFAILVFSGLGSLASARYTGRRNRTLLQLGGVLALLVVFYRSGLPFLIEELVWLPLGVRIATAAALIAPLGLCLGAFMPLGLARVAALGAYGREYVAWAWAVNGFFSVMASILSTILAMAFGFQLVLLVALAVYAVGIASLMQIPERG